MEGGIPELEGIRERQSVRTAVAGDVGPAARGLAGEGRVLWLAMSSMLFAVNAPRRRFDWIEMLTMPTLAPNVLTRLAARPSCGAVTSLPFPERGPVVQMTFALSNIG